MTRQRYKATARRLDAIACERHAAFGRFLASLSPVDKHTWLTSTLERLAQHGIIPAVPPNLWTLPPAEKTAYLARLQEQIPGNRDVDRIIWQEWHAWQAPRS